MTLAQARRFNDAQKYKKHKIDLFDEKKKIDYDKHIARGQDDTKFGLISPPKGSKNKMLGSNSKKPNFMEGVRNDNSND